LIEEVQKESLRQSRRLSVCPKKSFLHAGAFLRTSKSFQKMSTKKAALTAASLAEQKEGKRKGRKQMKKGKCAYL